jgi:alpha-glucosidase
MTKEGCVISRPPANLGLEPFYQKYCAVDGVPIIGSVDVPDLALRKAADIVMQMLAPIPNVRKKMLQNGLRVGVIGINQVTTDMPEYRDLYQQFPGVDWNKRTRGIGGTPFIPLATGAEENLLCHSNDRYRGESILVHEFAHTIKGMGLVFTSPGFQQTLQEAYAKAIASGLWSNTYAGTNVEEYWAEGVQSYFNTNREAVPPNGIHNFVNTREELQKYDPKLFEIIASVFPASDWTVMCP